MPTTKRDKQKELHDMHKLEESSLLNDAAFLATHTFTCFATDFATVPATDWVQHHSSMGFKDGKFHMDVDFAKKIPTSDAKETHWKEIAFGELFGDLVAIPATVALQHAAPKFMETLGKPLEFAFGMFYRDSAEKAANHWADTHGIERGSEEHYAYKQAHYRKEIKHLPQVAVWTLTAMAAGSASQKWLLPVISNGELENADGFGELFANATIGKVVTAIVANVPRLMAPGFVDHVEHEMSEAAEHLFKPKNRIQEPQTRQERILTAPELIAAYA